MKGLEYIFSKSINKAHEQNNIFIMVREKVLNMFFYHTLFIRRWKQQLVFQTYFGWCGIIDADVIIVKL